MHSLDNRLKALEKALSPSNGILSIYLKNGSKRKMLWSEALIYAIDGEILDAEGDDENLLALVKIMGV